MRKSILLVAFMLALVLSSSKPTQNPEALATHKSYFTANCQAAGQTTDDSCRNILFSDVASVEASSYDPAVTGAFASGDGLGMVYDAPVEYKGAALGDAGLAPSSAIKSIDIANGTYFSFTIRTGIHARRLNATTPFDLGLITAEDWAYSILRTLAVCNPTFNAITDYKFIYGAADWANFCLENPGNSTNEGVLLTHWNTFLSLDPVKASDASHFAIKVDADFNVTNGQQPFSPFLAILAGGQAAVYNKSEAEHRSGNLTTHLAMSCSALDREGSIGTGPYLIDETNTDSSKIILRRNEDYCEGERSDPTICKGPGVGGPLHSQRAKIIVLKAVPEENTRVQDLLSGAADMLPASLDPSFYSQFLSPSDGYRSVLPSLREEINFSVVPTLETSNFGLIVHRSSANRAQWGVSPLEGDCPESKGCKVRRAIIAAFNYTAYMQQVVRNLGTQLASFVPTGLPDSAADAVAAGILQAPRQNLTLASQLLHQAGYNSSNTLNLNCGYTILFEEDKEACFQLSSDLAQISDSTGAAGFVLVNTAVETAGQYYVDAVYGQKFDIATGYFIPDPDTDSAMRAYARSDSVGATLTGYVNSTLDAEIDQAAGIPDGAQRTSIYFDVMKTINEQCSCYMWREQPEIRAIYSAAISGYNIRGPNPLYYIFYQDLQKTLLTAQNAQAPKNNNLLLTTGGIVIVLVVTAATVLRARRIGRMKTVP